LPGVKTAVPTAWRKEPAQTGSINYITASPIRRFRKMSAISPDGSQRRRSDPPAPRTAALHERLVRLGRIPHDNRLLQPPRTRRQRNEIQHLALVEPRAGRNHVLQHHAIAHLDVFGLAVAGFAFIYAAFLVVRTYCRAWTFPAMPRFWFPCFSSADCNSWGWASSENISAEYIRKPRADRCISCDANILILPTKRPLEHGS